MSKNLAHSNQGLNKSRAYFPLVGIIVGSLSAIILLLCSYVLPLNVTVVLSMLSSVLITGAFHEDGLADSCDGLGGGYSKEQRLSIMKDSRIGTYGCIALALVLLTKFLGLAALAELSIGIVCLSLIIAHSFSRLFASHIIEFYDYVQDTDKSKVKPITARKLTTQGLFISLASCAPLGLALLIIKPSAIIALIIAALACWAFAQYCQRRIGGYTGDTLGASQQLSELLIYLSLLACWQ